jgi:hypothetical protein
MVSNAAAPSTLAAIALKYEGYKIAFATWATLSDRELHTHLGLLIFIISVVIFRRSLRSPWPWIAAILLEMVNEYFDRLAYGSWRWPDTRIDLLCTLIWPTLFFIGARTGLIKLR